MPPLSLLMSLTVALGAASVLLAADGPAAPKVNEKDLGKALEGKDVPAPAPDSPTSKPSAYPAPKTVGDVSTFGYGIQRTMHLLESSTPEHKNTVRVLFYGQSITEQDWWKKVADYLRQRYPNANLVIENRAIGGFSSQVLEKTAEQDLYSFYPDLLIFYVYGDHHAYERIIKNTRERTTAEILMQNDHVNKDSDFDEKYTPGQDLGKQWSAFINLEFLPKTAKQYGAELLDQRTPWKQYLRDNNLKAAALLKDGVHLNDHGNYLMAELMKPHFRLDPKLPDTGWKDWVKTSQVGADVNWKDGKLEMEFEGNRVDLIAAPGGQGRAQVLIDGKKPSAIPELYGFTRSTNYPGTPWPCLMRMGWKNPLVLEEWRATIKDHSDDCKTFKFELVGSVTGPDGAGESGKAFVSNSGRITIDPADWCMDRSRAYIKKPLPANFEVKWKIVPHFVDEYAAPTVTDTTKETAVTVAQGLPNGKHKLELIAAGGQPPALSAIRTYHPTGAAPAGK